MEKYPNASFRLSPRQIAYVEAHQEAGATASSIVKKGFEQFCVLLERSLPTFSEKEALFLCQALNGSKINPELVHRLWLDVQEEAEEHERLDIDVQALVARLKALTAFECLAVADAVERFWCGPFHVEDPILKLQEVGLVVRYKS